jgi:hypothetical protein
VTALSRYHPLRPEPASDCREKRRDFGPASDVSAVRRRMAQTNSDFLIGPVRVSHSYAIADWSIPGGGQVLLKRNGNEWKEIAGGGGALGIADLTKSYGVPLADAKMLIPQDVK